MTRLAAKALSRAGIAMLILCIGCRFIIRTESGLMGDNLAIIASVALTAVAMLYLRFAPQDDADRARTAQNSGVAQRERSTGSGATGAGGDRAKKATGSADQAGL